MVGTMLPVGQLIGKVNDLNIEDILMPSEILRSCYDDVQIQEITESIKANGLLHPLTVREKEGTFEIVAGCRRYYACKSLGWKKIPCCIISLDDIETFEVSLIENLERKSLAPLEEANAFKKYICDKQWGSITKLASRIGKSPSYINKRISLLQLPYDVQKKLEQSSLSPSTAEELFPLHNAEKQSKVATIAVEKNLPLKSVREMVKINLSEHQYMQEPSIGNDIYKIDQAINTLQKAVDKIVLLVYDDAHKLYRDKTTATLNSFVVTELLINTYKMLNGQIENYVKLKKKYSSNTLY